MLRRPPRSTQSRSSAASDVYKRQGVLAVILEVMSPGGFVMGTAGAVMVLLGAFGLRTVSYTHLRAHETPEHLVCRLLLEKKNKETEGKKYSTNKEWNCNEQLKETQN